MVRPQAGQCVYTAADRLCSILVTAGCQHPPQQPCEAQVVVELGNSQPFFKKYLATINGKEQEVTSPFTWKLLSGKNTLVVNCVDEFGRRGLPSTVTVERKEPVRP